MSDTVVISSGALTVEVARHGAELQRITDADGRDLLWDGDAAWWTGRAPLLFPIVGALVGGEYRIDGHHFALAKHGFARTSTFEASRAGPTSVTLGLRDSDETRRTYPFAFSLDVDFSLDGNRLTIAATLANPGELPLPASFGFHPALRWPLPYGGAREDHRLVLEADPGPLRRIDRNGLLRPEALPSPVDDRTLKPRDALFEDDALIFVTPAARSAWLGVPGRLGVAIDWDLPMLGIWTKPGAPYLCIEPWQGVADPVGYHGDFRDKPGVVEVAVDETRTFVMSLDFGVPEPA